MPDRARVVFVTGGTGFVGRRLVRALGATLDRGRDRLVLLARGPKLDAVRGELESLPVPAQAVEGDVAKMHLGLSGAEYKQLTSEVTEIWHLSGLHDPDAPAGALRAVNVEGTRQVLELARALRRLTRLHHFSNALVSGDREGVILEDELDVGQGFHNAYERSMFQAERLVRRTMAELPVTVYRPCEVVGDSRTGEVDRFEGAYYLAILLVASPLPIPVPLPGTGKAPLNVVPVDFVVDAALSIGANPAAVGATVHLVDPAPLSARKVYEIIAARSGKTLPAVPLPHRALETLFGLPFVERLARPQQDVIRIVNHLSIYNCRRQLELLEGTGIHCPPITSYLDRLIAFARGRFAASHLRPAVENEDPLDPAPRA